MYEQFFGLSEKPFSIQPDPSFLYWGRTHRLAYAMLEYGVLNHAGISVITGEVGCGKTTLIHRLLDQLSDTHTVALLSNVQAGRGNLLSWVLMAFGQPFDDNSHVGLFSQLQTFFISEYAKGKRIVLIIDEAQNLSMDMLEELRLLSNINAGKDQLLQLILVGQPQLKELLNRPELLQLAQRVGSDFHLTPLSRDEVQAYIETRLSIAGSHQRIFTERAIDLIAEQSRGVPRVINIIADTALVYAFSAEDRVVGVETVRNVVRDKLTYGVFGIASDEGGARPIPADEEAGPDAFANGGARLSDQLDPQEASHAAASGFSDLRATPHDRAMVGPPPQDEKSPPDQFAPSAAVSMTATVDLADPAPAPSRESETPAAAPAVATGVVITSADPEISPEATIRSVAREGRTIIFAPLAEMPEALSQARNAGAVVVENNGKPFQTGGRARNAGYRQLKRLASRLDYVQLIEAGAAIDPDWLPTAERFLERRPEVAMVEGAIIGGAGDKVEFSSIKDAKVLGEPGEIVMTASGAALVRAASFEAAGGFRGDLMSCDLEDLCIRQRRRGAHIWRLEADMAIYEKQRPTVGRWWRACRRRGFDNAYAVSLHGGPPERYGAAPTFRAVFWGGVFPLGVALLAGGAAFAASLVAPLTPAAVAAGGVVAAGLAVYLLLFFASVFRRGVFRPASWRRGFYSVFGKFPELLGAMRYWFGASRP